MDVFLSEFCRVDHSSALRKTCVLSQFSSSQKTNNDVRRYARNKRESDEESSSLSTVLPELSSELEAWRQAFITTSGPLAPSGICIVGRAYPLAYHEDGFP